MNLGRSQPDPSGSQNSQSPDCRFGHHRLVVSFSQDYHQSKAFRAILSREGVIALRQVPCMLPKF